MRRTFPDEASRWVIRAGAAGQSLRSARGGLVVVYTDEAATVLADITTVDGTAIADSTLTIDAWSRMPLFKGPDDDTDELWGVADGGPASPINARVDDRLDDVEATLPLKADLVAGLVPDAQLPAGIARDSEVVLLTQKGAANGVATLDGGGHLPDTQIPSTITRDSELSAAIAALVNSAPGVLDTLGELAAALQSDESAAAALSALVALKAPLASPALTGTPTVNGAVVEDRTHAAGAYVPFAEAVNTVAAAGAAQTIPDPATASVNRLTLTAASCALTFPSAPAAGLAKSFTLILIQDATGSRVVTWPASVRWSGGVAPVLTTTASKRDVLSFFCADGSTWVGGVFGLAFAL